MYPLCILQTRCRCGAVSTHLALSSQLPQRIEQLHSPFDALESNEVIFVRELHEHDPTLIRIRRVTHESPPALMSLRHQLDNNMLEKVSRLGAYDVVAKGLPILVDAHMTCKIRKTLENSTRLLGAYAHLTRPCTHLKRHSIALDRYMFDCNPHSKQQF